MDYDANFLLVLWIILAIKRRSGEALGGSWGGMERKSSDRNGQKSKKSKSNGKKCSYRGRLAVKKSGIFNWLQSQGNISDSEMLKTFNCGIGMILIVDSKETKNILNLLESSGEEGMIIGKILKSNDKNKLVAYK